MANNNNYTILKHLGSGHFGNVYKAKAKKGGRKFAIKKLVNTGWSTAQEEIEILEQVNHEHIIKYLLQPLYGGQDTLHCSGVC